MIPHAEEGAGCFAFHWFATWVLSVIVCVHFLLVSLVKKMFCHCGFPGNLLYYFCLFVCVEVLQPSQPNGVMSRVVSLPSHTFSWAGLVL